MKKLITFLTIAFCITAKAQIINTVVGNGYGAGNGQGGYSGDGGQATAAEMQEPFGIAFDAQGNYYISSNQNVIRKVNTAGIISTFAGITGGNLGDGGQVSAANINGPTGLSVDASNNLYIADQGHSLIRKVVLSTGIITTVAGDTNAFPGYSGDGGQATNALLSLPTAIAFDAAGNMYIADAMNNLIRKVSTVGIITTVAGDTTGLTSVSCSGYCNAGYSGDGGAATAAKLNYPYGVACDAAGNLFISDQNNNLIRKVNTTGIITTVCGNTTGAGTGSNGGYSGDGGQATNAKISLPYGISFDTGGNIYIADYQNVRIRVINTSGIINTVAGTGALGYTGDGGPATVATLNNPVDVRVNATGNLYIADAYNNVIREVCFNSCANAGIEPYLNTTEQISIYPNPTSGLFTIKAGSALGAIEIYNNIGVRVYSQYTNNLTTQIDINSLNSGVYIVKVGGAYHRIVKE